MAKAGTTRVFGQLLERLAADMDQAPVVASFEKQIRCAAQALVQNYRHPIGRADGWDGAEFAILKEAPKLIFGRETKALIHNALQSAELDAMSAWDHGEDVSKPVVHDNGFGHPIPRNMRSMGRSDTCRRARMRDDVIADILAFQILPKPRCNCHSRPPPAEFYLVK
jgi:hypothetical protein